MGKHFDVVFVAVKTYALTAVKREMDEAGVTFARSSWRTTASRRRRSMRRNLRER